MSASSGANTILVYRWEDDNTFNQDPGNVSDGTNKIFGANESFDSNDFSNNPERQYRPFRRFSEEIIETQFEGNWSTEASLTNTYWLQFFFGRPQSTSGSGPYTHNYATAPDTPPRSAQIIEETHHSDGFVEQTVYKGCLCSSIDADVSIEDMVTISLDGSYADSVTYDNPSGESPYGEIGSQPNLEYRPMHFGNSVLRMDVDDDGTAETKALVQDATINLEGNVEMGYELGTRFGVIPELLEFTPSIDYTNLVRGSFSGEERKQAYGSAVGTSPATPQETMEAQIDGELEFNANTSTSNKLVFNILGAFPEDYERSGVGDPSETLEDDLSRMANEVTATVTADQPSPD